MLSFTQISWAFGGVLEAILALLVMTNIHGDNAWRWLLGFSTLPVLTVMVLYPVSLFVGLVYCKVITNVYLLIIWKHKGLSAQKAVSIRG